MNTQKKPIPYDVAEHEVTGSLHIVAFDELVPDTPTFSPDEIEEARRYCAVLNAAYNAGVAGKRGSSDPAEDNPGYNTMKPSGSLD